MFFKQNDLGTTKFKTSMKHSAKCWSRMLKQWICGVFMRVYSVYTVYSVRNRYTVSTIHLAYILNAMHIVCTVYTVQRDQCGVVWCGVVWCDVMWCCGCCC